MKPYFCVPAVALAKAGVPIFLAKAGLPAEASAQAGFPFLAARGLDEVNFWRPNIGDRQYDLRGIRQALRVPHAFCEEFVP